MNYIPGMRVRIIDDCREGKTATGKEGVYEDSFTYSDWFANPRIRLDDGEVIWGIECWWEPLENAPSLEESQAAVERHKEVLRSMMT